MKVVLHFSTRRDARDRLAEILSSEAEQIREQAPDGTVVTFLSRLRDDPFGKSTRLQFTLDIRVPGDTETAAVDYLDGLAARLGDSIHPDLSTALVGEDHVFIEPKDAPLRFQALLRRNARFTHEAFLERYRSIHSHFGLNTPGIRGYVQFHVNPTRSKEAAARIGFGVWGVDSISELHLGSLEEFLGAVSNSPVPKEAMADEENFVDRENSLHFCSKIET